jgi:hypothetical protein
MRKWIDRGQLCTLGNRVNVILQQGIYVVCAPGRPGAACFYALLLLPRTTRPKRCRTFKLLGHFVEFALLSGIYTLPD